MTQALQVFGCNLITVVPVTDEYPSTWVIYLLESSMHNQLLFPKIMNTTMTKMQYTSDSTISGLLEVIIAKSQGSSSFKKLGIELLKSRLDESSEMRSHRFKKTSDKEIEEWISIINHITEMLEQELEYRMVKF